MSLPFGLSAGAGLAAWRKESLRIVEEWRSLINLDEAMVVRYLHSPATPNDPEGPHPTSIYQIALRAENRIVCLRVKGEHKALPSKSCAEVSSKRLTSVSPTGGKRKNGSQSASPEEVWRMVGAARSAAVLQRQSEEVAAANAQAAEVWRRRQGPSPDADRDSDEGGHRRPITVHDSDEPQTALPSAQDDNGMSLDDAMDDGTPRPSASELARQRQAEEHAAMAELMASQSEMSLDLSVVRGQGNDDEAQGGDDGDGNGDGDDDGMSEDEDDGRRTPVKKRRGSQGVQACDRPSLPSSRPPAAIVGGVGRSLRSRRSIPPGATPTGDYLNSYRSLDEASTQGTSDLSPSLRNALATSANDDGASSMYSYDSNATVRPQGSGFTPRRSARLGSVQRDLGPSPPSSSAWLPPTPSESSSVRRALKAVALEDPHAGHAVDGMESWDLETVDEDRKSLILR